MVDGRRVERRAGRNSSSVVSDLERTVRLQAAQKLGRKPLHLNEALHALNYGEEAAENFFGHLARHAYQRYKTAGRTPQNQLAFRNNFVQQQLQDYSSYRRERDRRG